MFLRSIPLLAAMLAIVFVDTATVLPAFSEDAIVPDIRLEKEETHGWIFKSFNFGDDDINFETYVPATAKVKTVEMRKFDRAKEIGSVTIIGKIQLASVPVEATIKGYHLTTPASAARVCAYEVENSEYTLRQIRSVSDFSATRLFAVQPGNPPFTSGVFSQCYARGDKVVTLHVVADLTKAANDDERKEIGKVARNVAGTLFTNLVFTNGRVSSYGSYMKEIEIEIGQKKIPLSFPDIWTVAVNDFKGPLPAELHLQREKNGKTEGLLWLFAHERKEKPDFQDVGPALVRDYFVQQSPDVKPPTLLASGEEEDFKKAGIASRLFRFSVTNKNGEDAGDIIAHVIWHDEKLYVVGVWSRLSPTADPDTFFSRLPGLTAFDLIQAGLLRAATEQGRAP